MGKRMTISEICKLTGLAPHTLRFYEKQFPDLLTAERTCGGHRIYSSDHLVAIRKILKCLREDRLSIKQAQEALQAPDKSPEIPENLHNITTNPAEPILKKLEELTTMYTRLDQVVDSLLVERNTDQRSTLLSQISGLRAENRRMVEILQKLARKDDSKPVPASVT
jgi:DNA-binding transcriptional MerR regulator